MIPMLLFLVLTLRGKNYTLSVGIAALLGCVLMGQGPKEFAGILVDNLGGTLGQVGLIIMFGSGLGLVMDAAGINKVIVNFVVKKIGVDSEKKGIFACYLVSLIMVCLIGTLNGGNAVVAPIILPIVAAAGLTPTTVCFLMFNAGLVGVTIGPFCSAVAAALGVSGLSYQDYMLYSALPYSIAWSIVSLILSFFIQKKTKAAGEKYEAIDVPAEFHATARQRNACIGFLVTFIGCLVYGLMTGSNMKYVMFVILLLSVVVGLFIDQPFEKTIKMFGQGMGKMGGMFFSFLLTGVMIDTITLGGGWEALSELILGLIGGKSALAHRNSGSGLPVTMGRIAAGMALIPAVPGVFRVLCLYVSLYAPGAVPGRSHALHRTEAHKRASKEKSGARGVVELSVPARGKAEVIASLAGGDENCVEAGKLLKALNGLTEAKFRLFQRKLEPYILIKKPEIGMLPQSPSPGAGLFEYCHLIFLPGQDESAGEAGNAGSHNGYAHILPGDGIGGGVCALGVAYGRSLQLTDLYGLTAKHSGALAGSRTVPGAELGGHGGKGDESAELLIRGVKSAAAHLLQKAPEIQAKWACESAGGGLTVKAAAQKTKDIFPFHIPSPFPLIYAFCFTYKKAVKIYVLYYYF